MRVDHDGATSASLVVKTEASVASSNLEHERFHSITAQQAHAEIIY